MSTKIGSIAPGPAWLGLLLGLAALTGTASAQDVRPGLVLERMESGVVVSPVAKLTSVDDELGTLAGLYGGWLTDGRLLIGAGAYWLIGRAGNVDMAYGGGVVEWVGPTWSRVSMSVGSLVGMGTATISTTITGPDHAPTFRPAAHGRFRHLGRGWPSPTVRYRETFVAAEPQATLTLRATDWLKVGVGAGYRLVGHAGGARDRLRGYTASLGIQLGPL